MKKIFPTLFLSICSIFANAQATHNMRVTFNNGNSVVFGMDSVKTVEFEEKTAEDFQTTYIINGVEYPIPEAVDLGLPSGTKWANMNLGAAKETDFGQYYAWGEIYGLNEITVDNDMNGTDKPKIDFSPFTYKWADHVRGLDFDGTIIKEYADENYRDNNEYLDYESVYKKYGKDTYFWYSDTPDYKTELDIEDDAAHFRLKGNWKMPTREQLQELVDNCTWEYFDNYKNLNICGYLVTSKIKGYTNVSIFLPLADYYSDTVLSIQYNGFITGMYWSSSLFNRDSKYDLFSAFCLELNPLNEPQNKIWVWGLARECGATIRPVCN